MPVPQANIRDVGHANVVAVCTLIGAQEESKEKQVRSSRQTRAAAGSQSQPI